MMWMNIIKVIVSKISIFKLVVAPRLQCEVNVFLLALASPPKETLLGLGLARLDVSLVDWHFVKDIVEDVLLFAEDTVLRLYGA